MSGVHRNRRAVAASVGVGVLLVLAAAMCSSPDPATPAPAPVTTQPPTPTVGPLGSPVTSTPQGTRAPTAAAKHPTATRAPAAAPKTGTATYFKDCAAMRAAGVAPAAAGSPAYRAALDRDHDGVACENDG